LIPISLQKLATGRKTKLIDGVDGAMGVPYPAAIAVVGAVRSKCLGLAPGSAKLKQCEATSWGDWLLVANNLSDNAVLLNSTTGKTVNSFDLSESDAVPSTYPVALAVAKDGTRAYVALWNASEVVELNVRRGTVGRKLPLLKPSDPVKPGTHPCALEMSPDGKTLYVALANRDSVAAMDVSGSGAEAKFALKGYFDTRLPGQSYFGAEPDALALSADGSKLYAANMGSDAVAVIDTAKLTKATVKEGFAEPDGFIPTEWMPTAMAMADLPTNAGRCTHGSLIRIAPMGIAPGRFSNAARLVWTRK